MNHPDLAVSNLMENSIGTSRVIAMHYSCGQIKSMLESSKHTFAGTVELSDTLHVYLLINYQNHDNLSIQILFLLLSLSLFHMVS